MLLTLLTLIQSLPELCHIISEDLMEKRKRRPIRIHFINNQERFDMFYRIQLKDFLMKLLYNSCETEPITTSKTRD